MRIGVPPNCLNFSSTKPNAAPGSCSRPAARKAATRRRRSVFARSVTPLAPSFRGNAKLRTRNLEIPGLVLTHHPGMTTLLPPQSHQRSVRCHHRIALRQLDLRNRFQRLAMIFRGRQRDVHFGSGRIGADDAKILARGKALMPGAGGKNGNVASRNLELLAAVAAEADPGMAAGDAERFVNRGVV